jgi:hypothetical protein
MIALGNRRMPPTLPWKPATASLLVAYATLAGCGIPTTGVPSSDAGADHHDATAADAADARSRSDVADAHSPSDAADLHPPSDAADTGSPSDASDTGSPSDAADTGSPSDAADAADGGSPSDAGDGGASTCGDGGYLFCDGFEDGFTHWTQTYVSGGTATVDSTHVYQGTHALHAHVDPVTDAGASAYAYVQQIQTWPTHVFARFFAYQPSPLPPSPVAILDMVQEFSPYAGIELLTDPPSGGLAMKTYNTAADQAWMSDSGATTTDVWTCFELEVDTVGETSHLYLNGTEVTDLAQTSLALPALGILGVGLSFYLPSVQEAEDTWIDDVAVNGARIGCSD